MYASLPTRLMLAALQAGAKKRTLAAKAYLFRKGQMPENVYFVQNGSIRFQINANLSAMMWTEKNYENKCLGAKEALLNVPYRMHAITTEQTTVLEVPVKDFLLFIGRYPQQKIDLMCTLAKDVVLWQQLEAY